MLRMKLITGVAVALLGAIAVSSVQAQPDRRGGEHMSLMRHMMRDQTSPLGRLIHGQIGRLMVLKAELGLLPEQRMRIMAIVCREMPDLLRDLEKVWNRRNALRNAVLADNPNEAAIRDAAREMGAAIGDMAVTVSKTTSQICKVLTPEQKEVVHKYMRDTDEAVAKFFQRSQEHAKMKATLIERIEKALETRKKEKPAEKKRPLLKRKPGEKPEADDPES